MAHVVSDISIYTGDMTEEEFKKRADTPSGYGAFEEFYVDEYEYKSALVRLTVKAAAGNSVPTLFRVRMVVDIPDTRDRGTAVILAEPTKVYFNQLYYHPPRVAVTVKASSQAVYPRLISIDKSDEGGRYFEVEILNSAGQNIAGTVIWKSNGY